MPDGRIQAQWFVLCLTLLIAAPGVVRADDKARGEKLFSDTIKPLLQRQCLSCHSHAAKKTSGGLTLDSRGGLLAGGDSGPAIVPGKPDESLLVKAVRRDADFVQMPPKEALSQVEVASLIEWIKLGAPWPGDQAAAVTRAANKITAESRAWWAFQPLRSAPPPALDTPWARGDLDRFILQKLNEVGLEPAPEASRRVLIRRLYFDLWGLPPSPEEVEAFEKDAAPDACERLVDRLLEGRAYGERWARYWLDLVRYADSDGYRIDDYRPNAWRYRDYVIDSFNRDKPYDRFVQEQLAGDELFPDSPEAQIATGYLTHGIYEYNSRDVRGQWDVILNDVTDTTGDVFLGMGLQCARCHDHKFDPILQKDYFRLRAFFAPLDFHVSAMVATAAEQRAYAEQLQGWERATAKLRSELDALEAPYRDKAAKSAIEKFPEDIQAMIRKPAAERLPLEQQLADLAYRQVTYEFDRLERNFKGDEKEKILALRRELAQQDTLKPPPLPRSQTVTDVGPQAPPVTIPKKGNTPVAPGYLSVLDERDAEIAPLSSVPGSTGRRAALARWLTQSDNPLTARVIVNRVWQYHFGQGLAANASDFGRLGEQPTHGELLDWLARTFIADGWSFKQLHRRILLSATYRQSAEHPKVAQGRLKDPQNRYLWRGNVRRLEAEPIRDALWAVTGELNDQPGGPGVPSAEPRRSIYTRIMRNARDPLLDVFDAPYWFSSASSRDTTTSPVQSLLLINSQFMLRRAHSLAQRLKSEVNEDETARIARAYQVVFNRAPREPETAAARAFLDAQTKRIEPDEAGSAQARFVHGRIRYRDGRAALVEPAQTQPALRVSHRDEMPRGSFTIESFVQPRSVSDGGAVRTIAAKWDGDSKNSGWAFGITGKKSRRKPQTLVLQMYGKKRDGTFGEAAVFSDQHVTLDKPYYVAAACRFATEQAHGEITFYLKDLSNDDEPLLVARVEHDLLGGVDNRLPMAIGSMSAPQRGIFDGLIDDVRWSDTALGVDQLLFTHEGVNKHTAGYWQFEVEPDVFRDASGHGWDIEAGSAASSKRVNVRDAAWVDFCHVLLNASEFLYVE